jgi:N-acetylglucosamine-6-phosphate deacetylase
METKLLVEQHFHGAYGVDFNTASVDDILFLAKEIIKDGVGYIFPTLVTDSIEHIKRQIKVIKTAANYQTHDMARICGVHLEGIFLNPEKKGIHNSDYFLKPMINNFKLLEDDFIKIVTLAPEFAYNEMLDYIHCKGIKIQAALYRRRFVKM